MQKRVNRWILGALVPLAIALPSCDPATAVALPILVITNSWTVESEPNRYFQFNSQNDGQDHGSFTGEEFVDDESINLLTGSWSEGELEFTVGEGHDAVTYSGTFDDQPDRLTVHSSTETIVLVRNS